MYVTDKSVYIRNGLEAEMKCIQIYGIEFLQTQNRQTNKLFSSFFFFSI